MLTHNRSLSSDKAPKPDPQTDRDDDFHIDVLHLSIFGSLSKLDQWFIKHFGTLYECTHRGPANYELMINAYGEPEFSVRGHGQQCPTCAVMHIVQRHARCPLCRKIILPGQAVSTLLIGKRTTDLPVRTACFHRPDGVISVCCDRMGCGGVTPTGTWTGTYYHDRESKERTATLLIQQ